MAGDGQVSLGQTVMKGQARKVRRIAEGKVVAGFAGATADAFTLLDRFEAKLKEYRGSLQRAAVELAKDWRTDRYLRRLEAMLIVMDKDATLLISGTGDVIEPDEGVIAIGSGGSYALAAARALVRSSDLSAAEIVDSTEYFVFPNFCPWLTPALPLVYRFRPDGNDHERCIMDVMLLHPIPDDGPRPDPAPLRILGDDDSFLEAPELNQISPVFEQDVSNFERVHKGLKTSKKGATLGNYQEARIRHLHLTLDKYLARS